MSDKLKKAEEAYLGSIENEIKLYEILKQAIIKVSDAQQQYEFARKTATVKMREFHEACKREVHERKESRFGRRISISDDDLCSTCKCCSFRPNDRSGCRKEWPCRFDDDGYVVMCNDYEKKDNE